MTTLTSGWPTTWPEVMRSSELSAKCPAINVSGVGNDRSGGATICATSAYSRVPQNSQSSQAFSSSSETRTEIMMEAYHFAMMQLIRSLAAEFASQHELNSFQS